MKNRTSTTTNQPISDSRGKFPMGAVRSQKAWGRSKGPSRIPKTVKEGRGLLSTGREDRIVMKKAENLVVYNCKK